MGAIGKIERTFPESSMQGRYKLKEHLPEIGVFPTLYRMENGEQQPFDELVPGEEYILRILVHDHPDLKTLSKKSRKKLGKIKYFTLEEELEDPELVMHVSVNSDPQCQPAQLLLTRIDRPSRRPYFVGTTHFIARENRKDVSFTLDVFLSRYVLTSLRVMYGEVTPVLEDSA